MSTLICIRQLPYAEQTVQTGGLVASLTGSGVRLMTVIKKEDQRNFALNELERARQLLGSLEVDIVVRRGRTTEEILKEAQAGSYKTIVVGAHGAAGLLDALAERVPAKVANEAPSSVLVVRGPVRTLKNILIPVGGQKMRKRVVKRGATLAKLAGAVVTLLYVTEPIPSMYTGLDAMDESLEELLQTTTPIARHLRWSATYLASRKVKADLKIRHGLTAEEIVLEADEGNFDLIVLGEPAVKGPLGGLFIRQVTPHIVDRAGCSVLVVR